MKKTTLASTCLLLLSACASSTNQDATEIGLTAAPSADLDPCEAAATQRARVQGLRTEGKLNRAVRVLARADTLCPKDVAQSEPARKELLAELASTSSPEELVAIAQRAPTKADAQRAYDRALAAIERDGGRVEVGTVVDAYAPTAQDNLELDRDGGRLAILQGNEVSVRHRAASYRETLRILGETSIVTAAFSEQDTLAVAETKRTTLWNLKTGALERTIDVAGVHDQLAFSPDGKFLATAVQGQDGLVIYEVATGNAVHRLAGRGGFVFTPDGRSLVHANGNALQSTDLSTSKLQWKVDGAFVMHSERRMTISKDGRRVRFASGYGLVTSIDVASRKREELAWETGVPDVPTILALSPDGELAVLSQTSAPMPAGLHSVKDRNVASMPIDGAGAETAAFSGDGRVYAFQAGRAIHIVDAVGTKLVATLEPTYAEPAAIALSRDGKHVAVAHRDGSVRVASSDGTVGRFSAGMLERVAISPDGKEVAGARQEPAIEAVLFDAAGQVRETLAGLRYMPTSVVFSPPDRKVLLATGTSTTKAASTSRFVEVPVPSAIWSQDRTRIALQSPHEVQVADQAGMLVTKITPTEGHVTAATFTPSNLLVMGVSHGWVVSNGPVQVKYAHESGPAALAFATEQRMASSDGKDVKVWDLADTRNEPRVYRLPGVLELQGSTGTFAWATPDGRVHLFDVASNRRATFVVPQDADGGVIHVGDAIEIIGATPEKAAAGLVCRVGQRTYPYELCAERFHAPGLLRAILDGSPLDVVP